MVPSVTDSPNWGSTTSTTAPDEAATGAAAAGGGGVTGVGAATGSGSTATASCTTGAAGAGAAGAGAAGAAVAAELSPISASCPPTSTTASTAAVISVSTPLTGAGISVSTLSVEISTNGSSTCTVSPTFFSQRVTVPSVTDSPNCGSTTGWAIVVPFLLFSREREVVYLKAPWWLRPLLQT